MFIEETKKIKIGLPQALIHYHNRNKTPPTIGLTPMTIVMKCKNKYMSKCCQRKTIIHQGEAELIVYLVIANAGLDNENRNKEYKQYKSRA